MVQPKLAGYTYHRCVYILDIPNISRYLIFINSKTKSHLITCKRLE